MTIAIKITNDDGRENAVVTVRKVSLVPKSAIPLVNFDAFKVLKGGESITEYVHGGQSLIVDEQQNG